MTNDTDTTAANADAANNSESSRAAAVIEPTNGLWERAAAVLRQQVSEAVWFSTFSDIIVERDTPGKVGGTMSLTLRVPNAFVRDRVLTRYMSLVRDALNEAGARWSRRRSRTESALHLRHVRERRFQPVRTRRRPTRGRNPRPLI